MHHVNKPIPEKNKLEIEKKLNAMGDYVKMSYLQRGLESNLDFDTRKFVLLRLAGIYETRKMFLEAAKLVKGAAEINTTFKDKINEYMKTIELYIKGNNYEEADLVLGQAIAISNIKEKTDLKLRVKEFYNSHAKLLFQDDKRSQARHAYEKLLTLDISFSERFEIQKGLLEIYDKLGLISEYYALQRSMKDFAL